VNALPERYRKARNIERGYEIRFMDAAGVATWLPVKQVLHIQAPLKVSAFTFDTSDVPDWNDGDQVSVHPDTSVYSRRPAAVQS
jgi:hypothetical protein